VVVAGVLGDVLRDRRRAGNQHVLRATFEDVHERAVQGVGQHEHPGDEGDPEEHRGGSQQQAHLVRTQAAQSNLQHDYDPTCPV